VRVVCMRDILILNEIWAQNKIFIYFGRLFAWLKYFTHHFQYRHWLPTISSVFCLRTKIEKHVID
jgi:hypothetical protein